MNDCVIWIYKYLKIKYIIAFSNTCKLFHHIGEDIWRMCFSRDFKSVGGYERYKLFHQINMFMKKIRMHGSVENMLEESSLILNQRMLETVSPIGKLKNLKWVYLNYNCLKELPDEMCNLNKLETLELHVNNLTTLPTNFHKLSSLKELMLSNNHVMMLPDGFERLNVIRLELQNNMLTHLDVGDNVKILNVSGNKLKKMNVFENVVDLNVGYNELSEFIGWKGLSSLMISDNVIEVLDLRVCRILRRLDASWNMLRKWEVYNCFKWMNFVNLSHNCIEVLPGEFGRMTGLIRLNLSHNKLRVLPESFGEIVMLTELDVSKNMLIDLPESMRRLKGLIKLNANGNRLKNIGGVGELITLKKLKVADNRMEELNIGEMELDRLDASNNRLRHVTIGKVNRLNLSGNMLSEFDVSINANLVGNKIVGLKLQQFDL